MGSAAAEKDDEELLDDAVHAAAVSSAPEVASGCGARPFRTRRARIDPYGSTSAGTSANVNLEEELDHLEFASLLGSVNSGPG